MIALPFLPVDSATSCSSQAPRLVDAGRGDERELVAARDWPRRRAARRATTPGLSAAGADARHASTIRAASSSKRGDVDPITAAGTMPNGDSAE